MRPGPLAAMLVLALLAGLVTPGSQPAVAVNPCTGTVSASAAGVTVVSVQGARLGGPDAGKREARIVAFGPDGEIEWVHRSGRDRSIVWSYDIDPLADGGLFVTATRPEQTVLYVLDPATGVVRWEETLDFVDTHDADVLDDGRLLVANMRNYNDTAGENDDRILLYNRTTDTVEWEWRFREHGFSAGGGGSYTDDWTHVNDVDALADGRFLVSVRNFDQVIVVDPETGEIDLRLGADDQQRTLFEQHNPQYLESQDGTPTILVADSEKDRVVEYERGLLGWSRTWEVSGGLSWARDADRLPSGNTLIVDSLNHRVVEVTPTGEIVWEVYAPWLVYDAERVELGDESGFANDLPTISDLGAAGSYSLDPPNGPTEQQLSACASVIAGFAPDAEFPESETPKRTPPLASETPATESDPTPDTAVPARSSRETVTPGQPGLGATVAFLSLVLVAAVTRRRQRT